MPFGIMPRFEVTFYDKIKDLLDPDAFEREVEAVIDEWGDLLDRHSAAMVVVLVSTTGDAGLSCFRARSAPLAKVNARPGASNSAGDRVGAFMRRDPPLEMT